MKRIVVAVDGSEGANKAAQFAGRLARDTGAALTLVHVYDMPSVAAMGLRHVSEGELARIREGLSRGSFEAARKAIGEGVSVDTVLEMGHPAEEICTVAARTGADLVVVGTRGMSEMKNLVLGSVSERVVRLAPVPVTVVR